MANEEKSLNQRLSGLSPDQLKALLRKGRDESAPRPGKPAKMERNAAGVYPLSKAQERMWFLDKLTEGEGLYNNPVALRMFAVFPLNIDILARSLGILTERHEILRTTFHLENGMPVQKVHTKGKPEILYEDLRSLPAAEKETWAMKEALEHGKMPIPLDTLPLTRFKVLHLDDLEYILLINPHHIISDGWSNALFAKELSMTYGALESNEPSPFPVPEYQYVDFVKWEKDWMSGPVYKEQLAFWKSQLEQLPDPLKLPLDFPRPAIMSHRGSKEVNSMDVAEADRLRQFCQKENITLFHLLFGAFSLLMSKYSNQSDIIVGVPVARRNQLSFQNTMGLFINTLPLRVRTREKQSALDFLKEIKAYSQQAFMRQELPFEKLIEEVNPDRNLGTNPVFQVHFVHQNIPSLYSVKGLSVKPESIDYSFSKFDLNFWVEEANNGLILSVTYPTDIFRPETIQNILHNYKLLLSSIVENTAEQCGRIKYFPESQRSLCRGNTEEYFGQGTSEPATWLGEFSSMAKEFPGNTALRDFHRRLTYSELDQESTHLAKVLARRGVGRGDLVGLLLPRNASLLISILGIFKAGAAYVPLDVHLPSERLDFISKDAGLKLIIGSQEVADAYTGAGAPVGLFENLMAEAGNGDLPYQTASDPSLAYVIYTSGTTGTPKGVCIGSEQLLNYSKAVWKRMKLNAGDSFATISSIAADLGNTMIFPPLIHGGEVVIVPEDLTTDAALLAEWLDKQPVDCLKIVPSHLLSLLHSEKSASLLPKKLLICGGEKCTPSLAQSVRSVSPGLRIINHYGPTESTIGSLTYEVPFEFDPALSSFPIGWPLDNTSVYITGNELQLLPKGVAGEIILSGKNIARGYLNRPELTAEKFAGDPFVPGERIYRTGDSGRMQDAGSVIFLGRSDHQVKIRGYRVETREIENVLNTSPLIEQAVVLIPEGAASVNTVQAAIRLKPGAACDEALLRAWLQKKLPAYMIPSAFHIYENFPLTPNGKIDLKELRRMTEPGSEASVSFTPPRDLVELKLLNIFREILKQDKMGIEDGFFDMGGHSLLAIQLFAAIDREFHVHLPLATLFERGNVMKMAELLRDSDRQQKPSALVPIRPGSGKKLLFLVHPAGGNVLCYYELGRELGQDYSVYGLQAAGLSGRTFDTVGDIAKSYLEDINLPADLNDVIFAGWSMGALIAFEMARQAGERTGKNPCLMIIDQLAPVEETMGKANAVIDPVDRMLVFAGKVAHLVGRSLGISATDLKGKSSEEQSEVFLKAFKGVNLVPPDMKLGDFHGYLELMIHHNEITSACRPGSFEGKTLLIRAEEALPPLDERSPVPDRSADLGWGKWIKKDLTIVNIPGNHVSVISEPFVANLAKTLMKWGEKEE